MSAPVKSKELTRSRHVFRLFTRHLQDNVDPLFAAGNATPKNVLSRSSELRFRQLPAEGEETYTDVVELCALLQCVGFRVMSVDSSASDGNSSQAEPGARTVVINWQSSGLHVVLETPGSNCSCPAPDTQHNSGMWQVSGATGGIQMEKEFGCTLLCSLPKAHRDRLTKELQEIIRCINQNNESDPEKIREDKSASMSELKTPEKRLFDLISDTPTRYRSLDTLTASNQAELPAPGSLQRAHLASEYSAEEVKIDKVEQIMNSTFILPSQTPSGSIRRRNKTSSPTHAPQNSMLDHLVAAEKAADELHHKLSLAVNEYMDQLKDDSSISSLALDASKKSIFKGPDSKAKFASSPNLYGIVSKDEFAKIRLKRSESASTSNLAPKPKEGKFSRLRRISPNIFKKKESPAIKIDKVKSQESKLNSLFRPRIVTPIYKPKPTPEPTPNISASSRNKYKPKPTPEPNPNISASSRNKFSHVKSTIPRPAKKERDMPKEI